MRQLYYKTLIVTSLLLCSTLYCHSQEPVIWQDHSDSTYVFRISRKEAEKFLLSPYKGRLIHNMLHSPCGSFAESWEDAPMQGHFMHANIRKDQVYYKYVPILPFQVFLFREYGVLTLQVVDHDGNIREDAKVRIRTKNRAFYTTVPFDKESRTYTLDDTSRKENRLLTVECNGFRALFELKKHIVNPSWFPPSSSGSTPQFYSYLITDKNKYKPGEKVRFKSYALTGNRTPLKKDLTVWMSTVQGKYKKISTVSSYHPGGYAGEVQLHDSLELRLDRRYNLQLRDPKGLVIGSTSFSYEDYELYDTQLEVKAKHLTHYFPDDNQIEIKATDANGLFLQDVKADIYIKRRQIHKTYTDLYVLPDTILHEQIRLDNTQPTTFSIPASLFGEADINYEVEVRVATYDTQPLVNRRYIPFYRSHRDLTGTLRNDSIFFTYLQLGKEVPVKAHLTCEGAPTDTVVQLPYGIPFRQSVRNYHLEIHGTDYKKKISVADLPNLLKVEGGFSADSFHVELRNPLQLDLSWYIYQGNRLLEKGNGKEMKFTQEEADKTTAYYTELFFFMGDQEKSYHRTFIPQTEYLNVDVDLPERVYPGQTLDATISVTNHRNEPVKNADLTAFATNSLLNYQVDDLPYYGSSPHRRERRSSYSINDKNADARQFLNYPLWNRIANLESLPYYQFTYPDKLFTYQVDTPEGTTEFAPYVMSQGKAVNIFVIEKDGIPIYFSWTNQLKAYSFHVSPLIEHTITLRLPDRAIILENFSFEKGKKTILSLDLNNLPRDTVGQTRNLVRQMPLIQNFTAEEKSRYASYLSSIPVSPRTTTFLEQKDTIYPIHNPCLLSARGTVLSGPVAPGRTRYNGGIEYRHEGGYSYEFEENVVYKYPTDVFPKTLTYSSTNQFDRLSDFTLSADRLRQEIATCQMLRDNWYPKSIQLSHIGIHINLLLPFSQEMSGVFSIIFTNRKDTIFYKGSREHRQIRVQVPEDTYDLVILYNSGKYLKRTDVPVQYHTYTEIKFREEDLQAADEQSENWFSLSPHIVSPFAEISAEKPAVSIRQVSQIYPAGMHEDYTLSGNVYDPEGEPIIGATVYIKGTSTGTITDIDGHFGIHLNDEYATLVVTYIGYKTKEIPVIRNSIQDIILEEDYMLLEEVVVVGYGTTMKGQMTGAIGITHAAYLSEPEKHLDTEDEEDEEDEIDEEALYQELLTLQGLRSNFSDVGFWEPALYTDKKGKATFTVTFPDNITRWDAVVYAMNRKLKTGTLRRSIRSYKPLMAELRTPRFLVQGDSSQFAANLRNYTKDPQIKGTLHFAQERDTLLTQPISFESSYPHYQRIEAPAADSLAVTLLFTRDDGYTDGEKRSIPLQWPGTEIADGKLLILDNGQVIEEVVEEEEEKHISITGDQLNVYQQTIKYLKGYPYLCNEQLASRLIGLLHNKIYCEYTQLPFRHNKEVEKIIRQLVENRNPQKLWSWWGRSSQTSYWMSSHILQALHMAREAGYTVKLDLTAQEDYKYTINYRSASLHDIELLYALSLWEVPQDYEAAIEILDSIVQREKMRSDSIARIYRQPHRESFIREKLRLLEIRQQQGIGYSADSLTRYLKKDIMGRLEVEDHSPYHWYKDKLPYTLSAYRIMRNDSALHSMLPAMQLNVLSTRGNHGWNTYQASSALSTVFPDLIKAGATREQPATIRLSGKDNREISAFPYETLLLPGEQLTIEKVAGIPLFYTEYTRRRVREESGKDVFRLETKFPEGDTLRIGKATTLTATVDVTRDNAEYVMIEIPIPAGCSYASQPRSTHPRETYREYYKERVVIFCEKMPKDIYRFDIPLLPRFEGVYQMNPAKVELMYFPVIYQNNDLRSISIQKE